MRRRDNCTNCQEPREIVSHGLCAKCYMAHRRELDSRDDPFGMSADKIQRRYLAERNKMLVNLTRIVKLVDETPCLSAGDVLTIKTTIQPYLVERAVSLAPKPAELTVNSETESTVNSDSQTSESQPKLAVNTESKLTVDPVNELTHETELTINSVKDEVGDEGLGPKPIELTVNSETQSTVDSDKERLVEWLRTHWATARMAAKHCPDLQDRRVKQVTALLEQLAAEKRIPATEVQNRPSFGQYTIALGTEDQRDWGPQPKECLNKPRGKTHWVAPGTEWATCGSRSKNYSDTPTCGKCKRALRLYRGSHSATVDSLGQSPGYPAGQRLQVPAQCGELLCESAGNRMSAEKFKP